MNNTRRDFLQQMAVSGVCIACSGAFGVLLQGCGDDPTTAASIPVDNGDPVIDLATDTALQSTGGAVKKRFSTINNGDVVIVARLDASTFVALSAQCTHQGSEVNLPSNGIIHCPAHGSTFELDSGDVIQGPATKSLKLFTATYNPQNETVTLS